MRTSMLCSLVLLGCGGMPAQESPDLAPATYVPFNEANTTVAKAQVAGVVQVDTITKAMAFGATSFGAFVVPASSDPTSLCTPAATPTAGSIAEQFGMNELCLSVTQAVQRHTYAAGTGTGALGLDMNQKIVAAIAAGANTTDKANATAQAQWIKKTFVRYLYERIYGLTLEGTQPAWDEAWALWTDKGLASTAKGRDTKFGTTFVADVDALFVAGRAALATNGSVATTATNIDDKLTLMLAYGAGSYFHRYITEPDKKVELHAEGAAFCQSISDVVKLKNPTGHTQMAAALAKAQVDFTDADALAVYTAIETAFGIKTE